MVTKLQLIPLKPCDLVPMAMKHRHYYIIMPSYQTPPLLILGISLDTSKDLPELHWLIDSCVRADICVFTTAPG